MLTSSSRNHLGPQAVVPRSLRESNSQVLERSDAKVGRTLIGFIKTVFGVCLVSIMREHQREYREEERLKRNLLR